MHWVFSVKAVTDELLHHWSRLPSLSYLRPGGDTQEGALLGFSTFILLSPVATATVQRRVYRCCQSRASARVPLSLRWHRSLMICMLGGRARVSVSCVAVVKKQNQSRRRLTSGSPAPRKKASAVLRQGILRGENQADCVVNTKITLRRYLIKSSTTVLLIWLVEEL